VRESRDGTAPAGKAGSAPGHEWKSARSTLTSPSVASAMARLYAGARLVDPLALSQAGGLLESLVNSLGGRPSDADLCRLFAAAGQPVGRDVGLLLYTLARLGRARVVVEFGTALGASALHLAAAIRDNGGGLLITTEFDQGKAARAEANLRAAGLLDLVRIYRGDALDTLRGLGRSVDFVFLDGWQDRYLAVLKLIEPHLRRGSVVVADDVFEGLIGEYLDYIRGPGYVSRLVALSSNVEISVRLVSCRLPP
jgi:predicted O-methyltransferase YrrM